MQCCKPSYATMCSQYIYALWLLNGGNYAVIPLHHDASRDEVKGTMIVYMCMHALHLMAAHVLRRLLHLLLVVQCLSC